MTAPTAAPCELWATEVDLCAPCDEFYDAERLPEMLEVASWVLYELSGRRYPGECTVTTRPCSQSAMQSSRPRDRRSMSVGDSWGWCGCTRPDRCGCGGISQIELSTLPVTAVSQVKVDGAILNPARYRVDDWRWLVRLADADGTRPSWPCCQRHDLASTEIGTFEVTFTHGVAPPVAGIMAAAALACQLVLSCSPDTIGECKLPKRVTTITRQGVTLGALDPMEFLDKGRTGIYEVDLFLATANPNGNRSRARVLSPDLPPLSRRVGT